MDLDTIRGMRMIRQYKVAKFLGEEMKIKYLISASGPACAHAYEPLWTVGPTPSPNQSEDALSRDLPRATTLSLSPTTRSDAKRSPASRLRRWNRSAKTGPGTPRP